jgi:hypothetical protein
MSGRVATTSLTVGLVLSNVCTAVWKFAIIRGPTERSSVAGSGDRSKSPMRSLPPMKIQTYWTSPRATWAARPGNSLRTRSSLVASLRAQL